MTRLNAARLATLIQRVYPRELAGSWDNTGLLLEPSFTRFGKQSILLCIDLTTSVCQEALDIDGCAHIVTYHPIIFSGLKSLTLSNAQQRSLLRLAAAGISVYSPHTSVDCVNGGVNDMLCDIIGGSRSVIEPCKVKGYEDAGVGRIVTIEPSTVEDITDRVKHGLGLSHVQLAVANRTIRTIGLCAGSGGSVLKNCDVDMILTGELSHHEILAFTARGTHVLLCGHDNTERPYLPIMAAKLQAEVGDEAVVKVSQSDRCPWSIT